MPKLDDEDSIDSDPPHDESNVEQDVHAKDQVNGELLDAVESTDGKAARSKAEEAEAHDDDDDDVNDDDDEEEGEDEFEVQSIKKHKFLKGDIYYHVHWKGYDEPKDWTWEPTDNILPGARDVLAEYHHSIGGEPRPPTSIKKSKSTQPHRRQSSAEESPAPKRRKVEESEKWIPKKQDWEPEVDYVENIERDKDGSLLVFLRFYNGKKLKVSMEQVYRHCPRPMLKFYESHLHFKSAEEDPSVF